MRDLRAIQTDPQADTPASSLAAERRQKINMASVRATLIPQLAAAFGCERYHLYTGHPLVAEMKRNESKRNAVSYER
jgi:hypothetical protein